MRKRIGCPQEQGITRIEERVDELLEIHMTASLPKHKTNTYIEYTIIWIVISTF